jgi:DnaJ-class molecular chaperone
MATRNILSESAPANIHSGTTIQNLEQMVEHCVTRGPLMTVAQIRQLLHVFDACEECEARGFIESRGYDSDSISQERCPECRGRGYIIPQRETVTQ